MLAITVRDFAFEMQPVTIIHGDKPIYETKALHIPSENAFEFDPDSTQLPEENDIVRTKRRDFLIRKIEDIDGFAGETYAIRAIY